MRKDSDAPDSRPGLVLPNHAGYCAVELNIKCSFVAAKS
jgi:hypothetical protein